MSPFDQKYHPKTDYDENNSDAVCCGCCGQALTDHDENCEIYLQWMAERAEPIGNDRHGEKIILTTQTGCNL